MTIDALVSPVYKPAMRIISAITQAPVASVTTTFAHGYITGTIVRLDIPQGHGMTQANQQFGPIVVTGDTTFTIPIDTTFYDAFSAPVSYPESAQKAQAVPFAEVNLLLKAAVQNVLNPNQ